MSQPTWLPMTVTVGTMALRSTWPKTTRLRGTPLSTAVRMYGMDSTCTVPTRAMRAM